MSLPRFSVENPVLVNMLMWVIIVSGAVIALTMTREMFPEFRPQKLAITTIHPGVSPQDIEKSITVKIEEAVRDVDGVEKVESTVSDSMSVTLLTLRSDVDDAHEVLAEVKGEVDAIEDLPADADKTTVKAIEPRLPVIAVAIYGEGDALARKRAAQQVRDDLLLLPGVREVDMTGGQEEEISVEVRPERLMQFDVTFDEVAAAVRESNVDLTGGTIEGQRSLVSVRTIGEKQHGSGLRDIVVKAFPDGRKVYVSDVANVRDGFIESDLETYFNGQPMLSCTVFKTGSQDAVDIAMLVKAYVAGKQRAAFDGFGLQAAANQPWYWRPLAVSWAHLNRALRLLVGKTDPDETYRRSQAKPYDHGFKVAIHSDIARFVEQRIGLMVENGWQGLFLVLCVLLLFLNRRSAFWAAAGLPVTFLGTFVLMWMFGQTINLVSLMGLILVLGIDVDEAIVMTENIYRYVEMGYSQKEAAILGSEEVMWPVVVMTGTTIGSFVPLLFLDGTIGDFLRVLPMVVAAAMIVSMIDALVILPSHLAGHGEKKPEPATNVVRRPGPIARARALFLSLYERAARVLVDQWYDVFIRLAMRWRYVTLAVSCATLLLSYGLFASGIVPVNWVQRMDSETIVAALEMPIGTPAAQTKQRLLELNRHITSLPEINYVQMFVSLNVDIGGEGAVGASLSPNLGQFIIELKPSDQRKRSSDEVIAELREQSKKLAGINSISFTALNGGPAGKALEIQLSGDNFKESLAAANEIKTKLATYTAVSDIDDNLNSGQREIQLRLREAARPLGMTVALLGGEVRSAFYGREARRFTRDREEVKIMVRYPKPLRRDVYRLESMWIPVATAPGSHGWVPFSEVAEIREGESENTIHRAEQDRSVRVNADVDELTGNDREILADVVKWYEKEVQPRYPGVRMELVGANQETSKFLSSVMIAYPISLFIIYGMLAALFRSYLQPLVVMAAVPFGVQGAILGHWIMGSEFTFMSAIGLVALNGVVVDDALVLVDFINNRRRTGLSHFEATVDASKLRLRAIVLTSVTTVAGVAPLMLETSFQAKFLIPLAISLAWGLIFATALTLVVVPAINLILVDTVAGFRRTWHGPEAVEELGEVTLSA